MFMITCSCGDIPEGINGERAFFTNMIKARAFINKNAPRTNPEHVGVIHEVSVIVPKEITHGE